MNRTDAWSIDSTERVARFDKTQVDGNKQAVAKVRRKMVRVRIKTGNERNKFGSPAVSRSVAIRFRCGLRARKNEKTGCFFTCLRASGMSLDAGELVGGLPQAI